MAFTPEEGRACAALLRLAVAEDLGDRGDITSAAVIPADRPGRAAFVARTPGVLAGLPAARMVFESVAPGVAFEEHLPDGSSLAEGAVIATVTGPMRGILTAERTALNFLQRLSGVASLTAKYVARVAGLPCVVLDTRKTTPGWRLLEKYAVRQGGGHNHRMGLYDGILIKDNHLASLGSVGEAVRSARAAHGNSVSLEVEVDTLEQLDEALRAGPDIVLLDNMPPPVLREAVARRNAVAPGVRLEASGGIRLETLRAIAEAGVDRISVGALTHSAMALDIGLDYLQR